MDDDFVHLPFWVQRRPDIAEYALDLAPFCQCSSHSGTAVREGIVITADNRAEVFELESLPKLDLIDCD